MILPDNRRGSTTEERLQKLSARLGTKAFNIGRAGKFDESDKT